MVEKIKIYDKGVDHPPYTDTYEEFHCSYRYGDAVIPYLRLTEPLQNECKDFIDCILDDHCSPVSNGSEGLKVVKILEAAQRSLNNSGTPEPVSLALVQQVSFEQ
jgi:predicted dehydrogenase